jgi:hypothetical protein
MLTQEEAFRRGICEHAEPRQEDPALSLPLSCACRCILWSVLAEGSLRE